MAHSGMTEAQKEELFHAVRIYTLLKMSAFAGKETFIVVIKRRLKGDFCSASFRTKQNFAGAMAAAEQSLRAFKPWGRVKQITLMRGIQDLLSEELGATSEYLENLKVELNTLFKAWHDGGREAYFSEAAVNADEGTDKTVFSPMLHRNWGDTPIDKVPATPRSAPPEAQPSWATMLCRFFCCSSSTRERSEAGESVKLLA